MNTPDNKRIEWHAAKFQRGLKGDFENIKDLANAILMEDGLLEALRKRFYQEASSAYQFHRKMLSYLRKEVKRLYYQCREGANLLPDLFDTIQAYEYYWGFFAWQSNWHAVPREMKAYNTPEQAQREARDKLLRSFYTTNQKLSQMVIDQAERWAQACRLGDFKAAHDLALLGACCDLQYHDAGFTKEEYQNWIFNADLLAARAAIDYLFRYSLLDLKKQHEQTAHALSTLHAYADLDEETDSDFSDIDLDEGDWHVRTRRITHRDLNLKAYDLDQLARIEGEFEHCD